MNKKLVICASNDNKETTIEESIMAIKKAGFNDVFVQWYDKDWSFTQQQQVDLCKKLGLNIEFAHLGYQDINNIWLADQKYDCFVERYIKDIKDCHDNGIDLVIMHLCSKFVAPIFNPIGLERFRKIVEYADSIGVKIAFENTKLRGYIGYILDNIPNTNIGICLDLGHYHCNFKDIWNLNDYKDRILAVHLHDNNGEEDQHLLPFDGTLDFNKGIRLLDELHYNGPTTLELCYRKDYCNKYTVEEFYQEAYKLGNKLNEI